MKNFISKHATVTAFNGAQSTFDKPHVAYIEENQGLNYQAYVAPVEQHDYVEIGGIKWATMNVGATEVTDYGLYFQWGDTQGYTAAQVGNGEGQKYFGFADYKYGNPSAANMTKYNSTDGKKVLEASDDAAQVNWGGSWRMPTETDFNALKAATTNAWVTNYGGSGVDGMLFTDKNDSSKVLFFPAAGYCSEGSVYSVGDSSSYWSSSRSTSKVDKGRELGIEYSGCWMYDDDRDRGFPIRGVLDD